MTSVATLNSACSTGHIGDTTPFNVAAFPVTGNISQRLNWFGTVRWRIRLHGDPDGAGARQAAGLHVAGKRSQLSCPQ
jgi:hypothetical protein